MDGLYFSHLVQYIETTDNYIKQIKFHKRDALTNEKWQIILAGTCD